MSDKIIEFYTKLCHYAKADITSDSKVIDPYKDNLPILIDGLPLALPTKDNLKQVNEVDPNTGQIKPVMLIFHPLRENVLQDPSKVIKAYHKRLSTYINLSLSVLISSLMKVLSTHPKDHLDWVEKLSSIKHTGRNTSIVDDKAIDNFNKLIKVGTQQRPTSHLVSLYLTKNADKKKDQNGKPYYRACLVDFPLYETLTKCDTKEARTFTDINGKSFQLRISDVELYKLLFREIFAEIDQPDAYSAYSNHKHHPTLDAILGSTYKLTLAMNQITDQFSDSFEATDLIKFDLSWYDMFSHIGDYEKDYLAIPPQDSIKTEQATTSPPTTTVTTNQPNTPNTTQQTDKEKIDVSSFYQQLNQPQQPVQPPPQQPSTTPQQTTSGKISLQEVYNPSAYQNPVPTMPVQPTPAMQQNMYPQPVAQQPVYPQQPYPNQVPYPQQQPMYPPQQPPMQPGYAQPQPYPQPQQPQATYANAYRLTQLNF